MVRLIVKTDLTPAEFHATIEAMFKARQLRDDLPLTIALLKTATPHVDMLLPTDPSWVNKDKCLEYDVEISRSWVYLPLNFCVEYFDSNKFQVIIHDYKTLFSKDVPFSLLTKCGLRNMNYVENIRKILIEEKEICDMTLLKYGNFFNFGFSIIQDSPTYVNELFKVPSEPILPQPTSLKEQLGKYITDSQIVKFIQNLIGNIVIEDLTDLEKQLVKECLPKFSSEKWIWEGYKILRLVRIHQKSINRLEEFIRLHGTKSDYLRPVTRPCIAECSKYQECIAQTIPAKTIKDQLEFCIKTAEDLPLYEDMKLWEEI
jgi:hypothetical protein